MMFLICKLYAVSYFLQRRNVLLLYTTFFLIKIQTKEPTYEVQGVYVYLYRYFSYIVTTITTFLIE